MNNLTSQQKGSLLALPKMSLDSTSGTYRKWMSGDGGDGDYIYEGTIYRGYNKENGAYAV